MKVPKFEAKSLSASPGAVMLLNNTKREDCVGALWNYPFSEGDTASFGGRSPSFCFWRSQAEKFLTPLPHNIPLSSSAAMVHSVYISFLLVILRGLDVLPLLCDRASSDAVAGSPWHFSPFFLSTSRSSCACGRRDNRSLRADCKDPSRTRAGSVWIPILPFFLVSSFAGGIAGFASARDRSRSLLASGRFPPDVQDLRPITRHASHNKSRVPPLRRFVCEEERN